MPGLPHALRVLGVPLLAVVVGVAVWLTADVQRSTATEGAERVSVSQSLLTAILDQETGLRGYLMTGEVQFLEPYTGGSEHYREAVQRMHRLVAGDRPLVAAAAAAARLADRWRAAAARAVVAAQRQGGRPRVDVRDALERKALMDAYRAEQAQLVTVLEAGRLAAQRRAALISALLAGAVLLLVGAVGTLFMRHRRRTEEAREERERRFTTGQTEFAEVMSVVASEEDAQELLRRHLVRSEPGRHVTVLTDEPECVAMRVGRTHAEDGTDDALVRCTVCGDRGAAMCSPLLVSGRVIGSALVHQDRPFDQRDRRRLRETVSQAAPVLGNLRAIAEAETKAATDALTGLPNRRAVDETIARMAAQAQRTQHPLAALAIDLDHFKAINDHFGHEKGDDVLAAVGTVLAATIRLSDFAGRMGGEEFIVLAPDTTAEGGLVLAEKLRVAISHIAVRDLDLPITASIGVAELPSDAPDARELLRRADRALYAAKNNGRDRVETASPVTPA